MACVPARRTHVIRSCSPANNQKWRGLIIFQGGSMKLGNSRPAKGCNEKEPGFTEHRNNCYRWWTGGPLRRLSLGAARISVLDSRCQRANWRRLEESMGLAPAFYASSPVGIRSEEHTSE